jgi:hypothetical protein
VNDEFPQNSSTAPCDTAWSRKVGVNKFHQDEETEVDAVGIKTISKFALVLVTYQNQILD